MNGRIYDPTLGRFLQADPHIQAPNNSQSYNRYSYVLNNPMSYTDPSGFFFKKLGKFIKRYWKVAVAAVATYVTAGAASGWATGWAASMGMTTTVSLGSFGSFTMLSTAGSAFVGAASGAIAGAVGGAILTGSLKGALKGAFSGATFGGINRYFGDTWNWNRVGANTVGGGVSSKVAGGNFADGARLSFALSVSRLGWEYTKEKTNYLKMKSVENGGLKAKRNKWEELLTDGGRDTYHDVEKYGPQRSNWLTEEGMALEGDKHLYNTDTFLGRFVNKVSKPHDWMNSDLSKSFGFLGYNSNGQWISASLGYNSAFQVYSFAGMLPAGIYTSAAMLAPYPVAAIDELRD